MMKIFNLNDKLNFGKYRGKTLEFVACSNPGYILWLKNNVEWADVSEDVYRLAVCVGIMQSDDRAKQYGTAADFGFNEF